MEGERTVVATPRAALRAVILRDGWIEPKYSAWPMANGRPVSLAVALRSCGVDRVDAAIIETVLLRPIDAWERAASRSQSEVLAFIEQLTDVNESMMRATYGPKWVSLVDLLRTAQSAFLEGRPPVPEETAGEVGESDVAAAAAWTAMSLTTGWPEGDARGLVRAAGVLMS